MNVKKQMNTLIENSFHIASCLSIIYFTYCSCYTKNITCQIIATDLDAAATLLEIITVLVGDVIPELLKSPVELQRLCKVPEL